MTAAMGYPRTPLSLAFCSIFLLTLCPRAQPQIISSMCLDSASKCPPVPLCGAFRVCNDNATVVVCSSCGVTAPNETPKRVCDFRYGRCMKNENVTLGLAGASCTPNKNNSCGSSFSCQRASSKGLQYKCCSDKCPPGAWGKPNFSWVNECGVKKACPALASQPPASSQGPPSSKLRPPNSGLRPPSSGLRPPNSGLKTPAAGSKKPPATGNRSPSSRVKPPTAGPRKPKAPPAPKSQPKR